eukprot:scaffold58427_cov69-Phaeocystis_antarctica.AAC.4
MRDSGCFWIPGCLVYISVLCSACFRRAGQLGLRRARAMARAGAGWGSRRRLSATQRVRACSGVLIARYASSSSTTPPDVTLSFGRRSSLSAPLRVDHVGRANRLRDDGHVSCASMWNLALACSGTESSATESVAASRLPSW